MIQLKSLMNEAGLDELKVKDLSRKKPTPMMMVPNIFWHSASIFS
jgi:hypothetical protein